MTENSALSVLEYENGAVFLKGYPRAVFVELTGNCNLACSMCSRAEMYGEKYNPALNMPIETFEKIAEELFRHADIIDLHGNGETAIHPDFLKALSITDRFPWRKRIVTNLMAISETAMERLVASNYQINISMDSPLKKDYESIRGKAKFEIMIRNLEKLDSYRKKYGTCTDLRIHMTLSHSNINQIALMTKLLSKFHISHLAIWHRFLDVNDPENIAASPETIREAAKKIVKESEKSVSGIEIRVINWPNAHRLLPAEMQFRCIKPWTYFHINNNGTPGICDYYESVPDLSGQTVWVPGWFKAIWNGKYYQELRKKHTSENMVSEKLGFCWNPCNKSRLIDFEDMLYPELAKYVISNFNRNLDLLQGTV